MNLHSPRPYSLIKHGIVRSYPSLKEDVEADVAIVGGGISGALVAWHLVNENIPVVLIEKRHIGMGSTAASTALLQYEIDVSLEELIKRRGKKAAVLSYLLCRDAIYKLESICRELDLETGFKRKFSFQYASHKSHISPLKREFELRKQAGIMLEMLGAREIKSKFGVMKDAGLLSADAASVDAYLLTHALLKRSTEIGLQVFDNTEVTSIEYQRNKIVLLTNWGPKIKAKKLVIACGYESQRYLSKRVETFYSTYAIASEISDQPFWYANSLIWETARPYLYMRTTDDNRVIIGGKDDEFSNPKTRDEKLDRKSRELTKSFEKLFPRILFRRDFSWAGTFASTKDGLPFIGKIAERPNTWFALGYGGNGITFSVIAAEMIRDDICGKHHEAEKIFSFDR